MGQELNGGAVSLAFDDGWKCTYDNALPLLDQRGIPSTHYIITKYLHEPQDEYVDIDAVHAIARRGHEIGCHTVSHRHLPKESDDTIQREVDLSLETLQQLSLQVRTFCYPFGEYDKRVINAVRSAGFHGARSIIRGYNHRHTNPYLLVTHLMGLGTHLSKVKTWVSRARAENSWLILTFHEIKNDGRYLSVPPAVLEQILEHLVAEKMRTVTVAEGLDLIHSRELNASVTGSV